MQGLCGPAPPNWLCFFKTSSECLGFRVSCLEFPAEGRRLALFFHFCPFYFYLFTFDLFLLPYSVFPTTQNSALRIKNSILLCRYYTILAVILQEKYRKFRILARRHEGKHQFQELRGLCVRRAWPRQRHRLSGNLCCRGRLVHVRPLSHGERTGGAFCQRC